MIHYAPYLVLNALLIIGIWKLFEPDMIFGKVGDWLEKKLGEFWSKPVFSCPSCMASVWGTAFFFALQLYEKIPWWGFTVYVIALCGLVTVIMMRES